VQDLTSELKNEPATFLYSPRRQHRFYFRDFPVRWKRIAFKKEHNESSHAILGF
jgi:hypothetical protein